MPRGQLDRVPDQRQIARDHERKGNAVLRARGAVQHDLDVTAHEDP